MRLHLRLEMAILAGVILLLATRVISGGKPLWPRVSSGPAPGDIVRESHRPFEREPGSHGQELKSREANRRLAALINAYHDVIRSTPARRPGWWGFATYFFWQRHSLLGRSWSLWQLEQEIRSFGDPRIHFALNCGATSCPPLREYDAQDLDRQLDLATRNYLADDGGIRIDEHDRTVYLSALFRWYRGDFGDPLRFVAPYLPPEQQQRLRRLGHQPRIRYLPWDWSVIRFQQRDD